MLVIRTQQDRFVGLGGDDLMRYGSPCPQSGGDTVAVAQTSPPWLFYVGWGCMIGGFAITLLLT
jgi:hypothetical protein